MKKEKPEEKEEEKPKEKKEEKKEEKPEERKERDVPPGKEGEQQKEGPEKDVSVKPAEQERTQPSTSRQVTSECIEEPKGKPGVVYGKPAPHKDIPFKVRHGKATGEDTTEYVYHGEDSISSEYSLTEEEE